MTARTEIDQPQHMTALARANKVRLARSELKHAVARGEESVASIVMRNSWEARNMGVGELLMSQHRWGSSRTRRFLTSIPMTETKTIGSMTPRQRREIAKLLDANEGEPNGEE